MQYNKNKGDCMTTQFERLRQDVVELDNYIKKLKNKKNVDESLITKLKNKRNFLVNHISEKQIEMQ